MFILFFFFNDTATTEIYTLSLHDALPILGKLLPLLARLGRRRRDSAKLLEYYWATIEECVPPEAIVSSLAAAGFGARSEEHTSELQSQSNLVCRLLLEKKKTT